MARAINPAIIFISGLPMPWVVIAAVPTLIPLVTAGVSGSNGIEFLFNDIPDNFLLKLLLFKAFKLSSFIIFLMIGSIYDDNFFSYNFKQF